MLTYLQLLLVEIDALPLLCVHLDQNRYLKKKKILEKIAVVLNIFDNPDHEPTNIFQN